MELPPKDLAALGTVIAEFLAAGLNERELLLLKLLIQQILSTITTIAFARPLENDKKLDKKLDKL